MARINFGVDDTIGNLGGGEYTPPDYIDTGPGGETGGKNNWVGNAIDLNPVDAPPQPRTSPPTFPNLVGGTITTNPSGGIGSVTLPGATSATPWASLYSGGSSATSGAYPADLLAAIDYANQNYYGFTKHTDPSYWLSMWQQDPAYTKQRLAGMGAGPADAARFGPYAGGDPNAERFGTSTGPAIPSYPTGNPGGFDDPSSQLFLNEVLNRLQQLKQPNNDPYEALLQLMALTRANNLSNPPYTSGEDAVLRAHYLEPLTQARDAALQRNRDAASQYGWLPSSGVLSHKNDLVEQGYERAVAGAANQTGMQAIDERQRRLDEQLSILNSLVNLSRSSFDRSEARAREVLQTAEVFPNFDEKRLATLLSASGEGASSPGSIVSGLTSLGSLGQRASSLNYAQGQDQSYALAQLIYALTHGLSG